ncbi:unnamed protein product [Paramecium pentaurelia]|uniref:Uncharacterized protein n=1 Tax=Paramecium pentaurelia TaxID=43138 RepID=A0A8S1T390_9CILI|nr:unnamed protein product [Paramecium pentaurelia]
MNQINYLSFQFENKFKLKKNQTKYKKILFEFIQITNISLQLPRVQKVQSLDLVKIRKIFNLGFCRLDFNSLLVVFIDIQSKVYLLKKEQELQAVFTSTILEYSKAEVLELHQNIQIIIKGK